MTTDIELQEQEQQEQQERQCRPVEELLKLDSYQDMTDEEINLVIAVKNTWAANDARLAAANQRNEEALQLAKERHDAILRELSATRDQLMANPFTVQVVSYEQE